MSCIPNTSHWPLTQHFSSWITHRLLTELTYLTLFSRVQEGKICPFGTDHPIDEIRKRTCGLSLSEIGGLEYIVVREMYSCCRCRRPSTSRKYCLESFKVSTRKSVLGEARQKLTTITRTRVNKYKNKLYFKIVRGEGGKRNDAETNEARQLVSKERIVNQKQRLNHWIQKSRNVTRPVRSSAQPFLIEFPVTG